jgi:cell division septation protein DedD
MKIKFIVVMILGVLFLSFTHIYAQAQKVRDYLRMVAMGKVEEVKKQLPDLLAEYPNDPGVQLLLGVVIDDANLAVEKYKNIVKNYPESEWADDAYWRIVQYYAVIGDTSKAKEELENYRKKYPASEFLIAATDVVRYAISYAKSEKRQIDEVHSSVSKDMKPVEPENKIKKETVKKEVVTASESKPKHEIPKKEATKVSVKNSNKDVAIKKTEQPANPNEKYGLQVGIYSTKEAADKEVARFKQQRLIAYVMNKDIDGNPMFAVVIGEYSSKESAEQAKKIVQSQCQCEPMIFKK